MWTFHCLCVCVSVFRCRFRLTTTLWVIWVPESIKVNQIHCWKLAKKKQNLAAVWLTACLYCEELREFCSWDSHTRWRGGAFITGPVLTSSGTSSRTQILRSKPETQHTKHKELFALCTFRELPSRPCCQLTSWPSRALRGLDGGHSLRLQGKLGAWQDWSPYTARSRPPPWSAPAAHPGNHWDIFLQELREKPNRKLRHKHTPACEEETHLQWCAQK